MSIIEAHEWATRNGVDIEFHHYTFIDPTTVEKHKWYTAEWHWKYKGNHYAKWNKIFRVSRQRTWNSVYNSCRYSKGYRRENYGNGQRK